MENADIKAIQRIKELNEALDLCGIELIDFSSPDAIIKRIHPEDRDYALRQSSKAVSENSVVAFECRLVNPDGEIRFVEIRVSPMRGTMMDITDRVRARIASAINEERFQQLFNQAPLGYQSLDRDGCFIDVNQKWLDTLGYDREEVIGAWFGDFLCPEYREAFRQRFPLFKAQGHIHSEFEMLNKDGRRQFIAFEGKIGYDKDGAFKRTHCILQDITERKRDETEREQYLKDLLESQRIAHIGTWRLNVETNHVVWSEELYKMYGFDPSIPPPPYTEHMKLFTSESWEKLSTALEITRTTGIPYEIELQTIKKDGSNGWMWVRGEANKDSSGNIISLWGAAQDITERKRTEEKVEKQNEIMSSLLKVLPVGVFMVDAIDGKPLLANEMAKELLGRGILPDANLINLAEVYKARKKDGTSAYPAEEMPIVKGMKGYDSYIDNMLVERPDGTEILLEIYGTPISDENGKPWASLVTFTDITERRLAEDSLKQSEEKFRLLYTSMDQGLALHEIITDEDGKPIDYVFLDINDSYTRMVGVTRDMCIGKRISEVMPKVEQYWIDIFGQVALTGEPSYYENYFKTTGKYYSTYTYSPKKRQFAVLVTDITEKKKHEEELTFLSYHDNLTGLYNRRFFEEELHRLDTKRNLPLSIIMGDINGLKIINDSFGHTVGDDYLKMTSEIIKKACRADDIVARLGGDEFVVILPNADSTEAVKISDRIKHMVSESNVGALELSVSFGYATKISIDQSILEVVISAENYMYTHKTYERASLRSKAIDIIMNTLFEKSDRESRHSNRVSTICEAIATHMDFNHDDVNQIRIVGLVHDIGKIGIKEEILNKPGRLDDVEWKEIKRHPEAGWRILNTVAEFAEISGLVLRHHEKWDGSGYPNGLKGEEIPIVSRIIAVADAYDAMTGERCYRKSVSSKVAAAEIRRCSGTQFDPKIVDVFLKSVLPQIQ